MAFLIETWDKPDSGALRKRHHAAHMAFLDERRKLLLACGAKRSDDFKTASGGIYLLDVNSRAAAEAFLAEDPFTVADLFERVVILRWSKVYLDGKAVSARRDQITES